MNLGNVTTSDEALKKIVKKEHLNGKSKFEMRLQN